MAGHLLLSQKNEALQRIADAGLNPTEFQWKVETQDRSLSGYPYPAEIGHRLVHTPTKYYFSFLDVNKLVTDFPSGGPHSVRFSPNRDYVEGGGSQIHWPERRKAK